MPLWAWLSILLCITYSGLVLWRAWAHEYVKYGPIRYTRQANPRSFWFFVTLFAIAEIWFAGWFIIVVISLISGPVFHQ